MPDGILKTPSLVSYEIKEIKLVDQDEGSNQLNVDADLEKA